MRELLQRERNYRVLLAIADAGAMTLAVMAACAIQGHNPTVWMLLVPVVAVLAGKVERLYDRDDELIVKTTLGEWRVVLRTVTFLSILEFLAWSAMTDASRHRVRLLLFLLAVGFGLAIVGRACARRLARSISPVERCVIIGDPAQTGGLARRLHDNPGVELVGTIPDQALSGSVVELRDAVEELNVHRLVVAPGAVAQDHRSMYVIQAARFIGVRVSLQPTAMTAVGGWASFDDLDGMTLLGVPRFGLSSSSLALKRGFDLVVAVLALVILSPVIVVIALAVKLDSPGPVFFRQRRVGRNGKPFEIRKFRSMVDGADAMKTDLHAHNEATGGLFKMARDPRVTRVGARIRATHLDELPQLLNVIAGEMSLVGPRPLIVEEDALLLGRDRRRLHLPPGMTGPWQIRGPLHTPLADMAMLDYRYASNWSIWQDVDILIQTVLRVVNRSGH